MNDSIGSPAGEQRESFAYGPVADIWSLYTTAWHAFEAAPDEAKAAGAELAYRRWARTVPIPPAEVDRSMVALRTVMRRMIVARCIS